GSSRRSLTTPPGATVAPTRPPAASPTPWIALTFSWYWFMAAICFCRSLMSCSGPMSSMPRSYPGSGRGPFNLDLLEIRHTVATAVHHVQRGEVAKEPTDERDQSGDGAHDNRQDSRPSGGGHGAEHGGHGNPDAGRVERAQRREKRRD